MSGVLSGIAHTGGVKLTAAELWVTTAEEGDRFTYARAKYLAAVPNAGDYFRELQDRGLVNLCQRRCDEGFAYEAQRTSRSLTDPVRPGQRSSAAPRHYVPSRPDFPAAPLGWAR